ncbi:haloacid dehalogenase [candidate division KSB3 bacterium]|uniref:Haloacid dehalogenase n=1 Tax=candidate division KSB3 bacterium TaxID=2044937 RepID=A0A2G6KCD5_9BACT|nr:MAG: haloacid dehalogenase [candidate division KSB3 bacterium]
MKNSHRILDAFQPEKSFFIGIDSDGCVFDTMEIKQKQCFCPNTIECWNLQAIAEYVAEVIEFVNLYSIFRGTNRFPSLVMVMDFLRERSDVVDGSSLIPDMTPLSAWIEQETQLGNLTLERYAKTVNDPIVTTTLQWSLAVNATIEKIVKAVPSFPFVRESLKKMIEKADTIVVSQTPLEALEREWEEHHMSQFVRLIAGQEYGSKAEHLTYAAKGKYPDDNILMIGDALGDLNAAKQNGCLFYPINPGRETASWERFYQEGLEKFFQGTYAGAYEETVITEFHSYLPATPPWKR